MKKSKGWHYEIKGSLQTAFFGGTPKDIDDLVNSGNKNTQEMEWKIQKAAMELCIQAGDIDGAVAILEKHKNSQFSYRNPLNMIQRDNHNGGNPFMGAHMVFGAFAASAKWICPKSFYQNKQGQTTQPAKKHLRKSVYIRPTHIHFTREGKLVDSIDSIHKQQPSEDVPGFAQYELIDLPAEFAFKLCIEPEGKFKTMLTIENTALIINHMPLNGLGSCRGRGQGQWEILDCRRTDW